MSVQSSAMLIENRARIADFAVQTRLPTICTSSTYVPDLVAAFACRFSTHPSVRSFRLSSA